MGGLTVICLAPLIAACAGGQQGAGQAQLQPAPISSVSSEALAPPPGVGQQATAQQVAAQQVAGAQVPGQFPGQVQGQVPNQVQGQAPGQPVYQQPGVPQQPGQFGQQTQPGQFGQPAQQAQQVANQTLAQAQTQAQAQLPAQAQTQLQQAAASAAPPTQQELLGQWTIADNIVQCQLNVSLTGWQGGYRASTRNCHGSELKQVGAWNISGNQVILKTQDGAQLAVLRRTGPRRFDGALAAGGPVAMLR
ncbi:MAG: AprI/Inh family metalloprotease inhibitor [Pseudomonadota bacterium]